MYVWYGMIMGTMGRWKALGVFKILVVFDKISFMSGGMVGEGVLKT